jgi:hypothetical protein
MGAHAYISSSKKSAPGRKTRIFCGKYPHLEGYCAGLWGKISGADQDTKKHAWFIVYWAASIGARV